MRSLTHEEARSLRDAHVLLDPEETYDDGDDNEDAIALAEMLAERGLVRWVEQTYEDDEFLYTWTESLATDYGRLALRIYEVALAAGAI